MKVEDVQIKQTNSTSGLGSASQLVNGTVVPVAAGEANLTAMSASRVIRVRLMPGRSKPVLMKARPRLMSEASWKRLAAQERRKARKRGLNPSDIEKAIEASRYGR